MLRTYVITYKSKHVPSRPGWARQRAHTRRKRGTRALGLRPLQHITLGSGRIGAVSQAASALTFVFLSALPGG